MEGLTERIPLLLQGSSNEEKVGGLLLSVKLLETDVLNESESKAFLHRLYTFVSPDFIVKLMWNQEKRRLFRQAAMSLIACSIQHGFASKYSDFGLPLIRLLFSALLSSEKSSAKGINRAEDDTIVSSSPESLHSEASSDQKYDKQFVLDLVLTLKWIAAESNRTTVYNILAETLLNAGNVTTELPPYLYPSLLEFVTDLCQMQCHPSSSPEATDEATAMSNESAVMLRLLVVKGFHGGAPEAVRDSALQCSLQLLSSSSPLTNTTNSPAVELDPIDTDTAGLTLDKFAMLLVSIVGIEVHLLLEEALALFKQPQGEPEEKSYGDLRDPAEERKKKYDEVKLDSGGDYTLIRTKRLLKMIPCTMSILNAVLLLLVGRDDGDNNMVEAHWMSLPSPAILHIRQQVHNIFQKIFDFLKEISDISQTVLINVNRISPPSECIEGSIIDSRLRNDILLVKVVRQVTAALCLWVLEDEDMRDSFVQNLPLLLMWSAVPIHFRNSDSNDGTDLTADAKLGTMIWAPSRLIVWTALTEPIEFNDSKGADDIGDVLHYILPCLAEISEGLAPEDELAEKLCTVGGGSLFTRLVNLSLLVSDNSTVLKGNDKISRAEKNKSSDVRERDMTKYSPASYSRVCHTCSSGCDLLTAMFAWRKNDIIVLRKGETESEALCAIFTLSKDTFPIIPSVSAYNLSRSKRNMEDRHAERLADLLAVASGIFNGVKGESKVKSSTPLSVLNEAVSSLVLILGAVSVE